MICSLCHENTLIEFTKDSRRAYYQCQTCYLINTDPSTFPNKTDEISFYQNHQNDVFDLNYREFLNNIFIPMRKLIPNYSHGLDFGCGPGPALAEMFKEGGHPMSIYDYYFYPDKSSLNARYNFIVSTETIEHLHHPRKELDRLWSLLENGGYMGLMTGIYTTKDFFENWHYKLDPTHVVFYHENTFQWLSKLWNANLIYQKENVVIFLKES